MGNFAISMVGNAIIGFLMAAFVLSVLKPRFSFALTAVITLFVVFYASLYGMLLLPANTPPLIKMSIGIVWDTCWGLFLFTDKRMKVVLSAVSYTHLAYAAQHAKPHKQQILQQA